MKINKEEIWFYFQQYWLGALLLAICLGLMIALCYLFGVVSPATGKDLLLLAREGKITSGQILEIKPYRFITQGEHKIGGGEGYTVTIEYRNEHGQAEWIIEEWPQSLMDKQDDLTGTYVQVYYLDANQYVRAATVRNPALQRAIEITGADSRERNKLPGI